MPNDLYEVLARSGLNVAPRARTRLSALNPRPRLIRFAGCWSCEVSDGSDVRYLSFFREPSRAVCLANENMERLPFSFSFLSFFLVFFRDT